VRVTACVVSWNCGPQLVGALGALTAQTGVDLDVVVIDNASADGSADVARAHGVEVVRNAANTGFAAAANQGAALARARGSEALLLCNFDIRLRPDYVASAAAALSADPFRGSVQGKLLRAAPGPAGEPIIDTTGHLAFASRLFRNRGEGSVDDGRFDVAEEVFGVSGAVALYRLAALDDVALDGEVFAEDLFAYWEDVDLDWRLALRGWRCWYTPDALGWHERGGAGPRRSAVVERLNFVNRFLVIARNDDGPALARALPGVLTTTALKAGELAVTVPSAFLRSVPALGALPRALEQRRRIQASARVDPAAVVDRWFRPFDYGAWVATWWRRVRAESTGAAPPPAPPGP
jgi:GT2 family glycosyltransferase